MLIALQQALGVVQIIGVGKGRGEENQPTESVPRN